MTIYENELQLLKSWDEIQFTERLTNGYDFIETAGHGYMIIPATDKHYREAVKICEYGFKGSLAVYLEEDCEAGQFNKLIM